MSVHIANQIIKKEWTDYNNHMNMAYYVLIFDQIWEIMLTKFKMGENSAKTTNRSTMVVETHTTYNSEVKEGDEVEIILTFFEYGVVLLLLRYDLVVFFGYDGHKYVNGRQTSIKIINPK